MPGERRAEPVAAFRSLLPPVSGVGSPVWAPLRSSNVSDTVGRGPHPGNASARIEARAAAQSSGTSDAVMAIDRDQLPGTRTVR